MLPDLRLLIPVTFVAFFLAAAAGLYASLRVAQDSLVADNRGMTEESPINRIVASWPLPDANRPAAMIELSQLLKDAGHASSGRTIPVPESGSDGRSTPSADIGPTAEDTVSKSSVPGQPDASDAAPDAEELPTGSIDPQSAPTPPQSVAAPPLLDESSAPEFEARTLPPPPATAERPVRRNSRTTRRTSAPQAPDQPAIPEPGMTVHQMTSNAPSNTFHTPTY